MRFAGGICFVLSCVVMFGAQGKVVDDDPFFDRFRYGLEVIRRLFGAESTSHFAAFFSPFKNRSGSNEQTGEDFDNDVLSAIIKSISGDQKEIAAAGIKISVLVAKMISDAFPQTKRTPRKSDSSDQTLFSLVLSLPQIRRLIWTAQDPGLTEKIVKELEERTNSHCVRLLACKLSSIVRGMQRSLIFFTGGHDSREHDGHTWARSTPVERMYLFLPSMNEFLESGDICDEQHPLCIY